MKSEYNNALQTFKDNNESIDLFLKADLFNKVGLNKEAELTRKSAEEIYKKQLNQYNEKSKRIEYIERTKKYKTVEAYKNWLEEQRKEYKFN